MKIVKGFLIGTAFAFMTACGSGETKVAETPVSEEESMPLVENEEKVEDETEAEDDLVAKKALLTSQTWGYDVEAFLKANFTEADLKNMGEEAKTELEMDLRISSIKFEEDGSYRSSSKGDLEKGSWNLSQNELTTNYSKNGQDKEDVVTIVELNADKMVLKTKNGQKIITITMIKHIPHEGGM